MEAGRKCIQADFPALLASLPKEMLFSIAMLASKTSAANYRGSSEAERRTNFVLSPSLLLQTEAFQGIHCNTTSW